MKSPSKKGGSSRPFALVVTKPVRPETVPPCQVSCPNAGDIRGWIGVIGQHKKLGLSREDAIRVAWLRIVDRNPFPATLGRICPHPCESGCNRSAKDEPVAINAMERFIGDRAVDLQWDFEPIEEQKEEDVAVIGAGPAGLSFAYQMARRGYSVKMFEARPKAGGMLRYGIPDYRMPPAILDAEIARIERLGVTILSGVQIAETDMDEVRNRFDIVFVGIGAQRSLLPGIPGESGEGFWTGTDFLAAVNTGKNLDPGDHVVVIGGGNTAVDVARTAVRLGSRATICYRRTRKEMPANGRELEAALAEGVVIEFLVAPKAIARDGRGRISTVSFQRMKLDGIDDSGRRKPVPMSGCELNIFASAVVAAVAQVPEWDDLRTDDAEGRQDRPGDGILLGGDVLGLGIAGEAIVQGRIAAEAIHSRLYGIEAPPDGSENVVQSDQLWLGYYPDVPRVNLPEVPVESRITSLKTELHATLDEDAFFMEASRCMSCGACFGCTNCFMFCNASCYRPMERPIPGSYFGLDLTLCEGCTKCVELCPSATIQ